MLTRRRTATVIAAGCLAVVTAGPGTGRSASLTTGTPASAGRWTAPFEEGGAATPRCAAGGGGELLCKPVAQAAAVLPDGRVFYFNGQEGSENVERSYASDLGTRARGAQARVLDLRTGIPGWTTPTPAHGGGVNSDIRPGNRGGLSDPLGTAGVPGRPGDGLVGSTAGRVAPHDPQNHPDDGAANDADMFCADLSPLADGRVLITGGTDWYDEPAATGREAGPAHLGALEIAGIRTTRIFDPATDTFASAGPMYHPRWYPSTVELAGGKVLVVSGMVKLTKPTQLSNVRRTETFDPATGTWTVNDTGPASESSLPVLPRVRLMPNGKVFYGGTGHAWSPNGGAADEAAFALQQFFDPATGRWEATGVAPLGFRGTAAEVMLPLEPPYDAATLLTYGGTLGPPPGSGLAVPFSTLTTVDRHGRVTNRLSGNLNHARWFSSGILLPDGQVLAVNGADRDAVLVTGLDVPVRIPELYDPKTGRWTEMAAQARDRTYHSSAVLLADGRVLVGGHFPAGVMWGRQSDAGKPFTNNDPDPSFEIWSPPYLFRGPRPSISHAPAGVAWGETFSIGTPDADRIESVVLVKVPTTMHVIDPDQRSVVLPFRRDGAGVQATAPPDGVVAPPGAYYLFVNQRSPRGPIPSVARIVSVGERRDPAEATQPFAEAAGAPAGTATEPDDSSSMRGATRL